MLTTFGLGFLISLRGSAAVPLPAELVQVKRVPQYVSTSASPVDRCEIYNTMGYGDSLRRELLQISPTGQTFVELDALMHLKLTKYADTITKTAGPQATLEVIDHLIKTLPKMNHKERALAEFKSFKQIPETSPILKGLPKRTDDELLVSFERSLKSREEDRIFHLLAMKAEFLAGTSRKSELIEDVKAQQARLAEKSREIKSYEGLVRDLQLIGTPVPIASFADAIDSNVVRELPKGKVVVLIQSDRYGRSFWSDSRSRIHGLYADFKNSGLEIFTLVPATDRIDKLDQGRLKRNIENYKIQWPIVTVSDAGAFTNPNGRWQLTIVDRRGVIRHIITNDFRYRPFDVFEKVREKVQLLLAEDV